MILLCGNEVGRMALFYFKDILQAFVPYDDANRRFGNSLGIHEINLVYLANFDVGGQNILSVHGREVLKNNILSIHECHNVHPYLYKYKGKDPVGRAIKDGNTLASVGLHRMTEKPDMGPVVCELFKRVNLTTSEEVYRQIYELYDICFAVYRHGVLCRP